MIPDAWAIPATVALMAVVVVLYVAVIALYTGDPHNDARKDVTS